MPQIEAGLALDDPLRHLPAHTAGAGQAVGAESGRHPEPGHVRLAQDELAVGRERLRAVEQLAHLRALHRRHPPDRVGQQLVEPLPVLGQQLRLEPIRHPVQRPGGGIALVAAHDQAAHLGAPVDEVVGIAQRRQRLQRRVERLGDQELVGVGDDRHVDADHAGDLWCVHAAGVDHDVGADRALVGYHLVHAAVLQTDLEHPRALLDLSPAQACAVGQREGQLAGVEVAVLGQERRPQHAVGRHRREQRLRLVGRDQLHRQAEALRPARLPLQLLHARLRGGQPQPTQLVPAGVLAGLALEVGVQADRVLHHLGQADGRAQLSDQPGGVPGRAVREAVLLDQHDVAPAHLRQVVEDAAAAHTTTDHHRPRLTPHRTAPSQLV